MDVDFALVFWRLFVEGVFGRRDRVTTTLMKGRKVFSRGFFGGGMG
jgi:hypothetical protein